MIRDLKSSKKENTEITCEQKFLHKKFIKLCVFEDCQSNSASQELKLCQTSEGFSKSSCSTVSQKPVDFEVEQFLASDSLRGWI